MDIFITGEIYWETRIGKIINSIPRDEISAYFNQKELQLPFSGFTLVWVCRHNQERFTQRQKYVKKRKELSFDVFIDLEIYLNASPKEKHKILIDLTEERLNIVLKQFKLVDENNDTIIFVKEFLSYISIKLKEFFK